MSNPIPPENAAQAADALAQRLLQACPTLPPVTAVLQRNLARSAELSEQVAAHALDWPVVDHAGALDGDALKLIDKHCQLAKQIASVARILRDERV